MVRGLGYVKDIRDLEQIPLGTAPGGTPLLLRDVARVTLGPEIRRGLADWNGEGETVGGVVVVRWGADTLSTIARIKERLAEIKSHMKYSFAMGMDTPGRIAGTMAHYLQMTGDYETVNRVYDLYDQVTPQDIMDMAQRYFAEEKRTVVTLTYGGEK